MRVFVLTLGTRGDFELFLALGRALVRDGHEVVLGSSPCFAERARLGGLEPAPLGSGQQHEMVSILRSLAELPDPVERTRAYAVRWLRPQLAEARGAIAAHAGRADYFVSNLKMAMRRGDTVIPGASVSYDPPRTLDDLARYPGRAHPREILELVALSRPLLDAEGRWGPEFHFTGFWHESGPAAPDAALREFVEGGRAPVVLTMGSMVMFDPDALVHEFAAALRQTGRRGVVVAGWSGLARSAFGSAAGEQLHCVAEADYDWLFARAASVVHHGGTGTVGAVLRAGRPSIIVPQIACQVQFGELLLREQLASAVLDVRVLEAGRLAAAIEVAGEERLLESARRWQKTVSAEGGVEAAAALIGAHAGELGLGR